MSDFNKLSYSLHSQEDINNKVMCGRVSLLQTNKYVKGTFKNSHDKENLAKRKTSKGGLMAHWKVMCQGSFWGIFWDLISKVNF